MLKTSILKIILKNTTERNYRQSKEVDVQGLEDSILRCQFSLKMTKRFSAMPIKIPESVFLAKNWQTNSKIYVEMQRT